jgi:signal peptidase I
MKEFIKDLCVAAIIVVVIMQFYEPTRVFGISMQPSFYEKDYLVLSKEAYARETPQRGDVIVFKSQLRTIDGKKELLIKRVIGLPGDTVEVRDGNVYINGAIQDDSYTEDHYTNGTMKIKVPKDEYFCMGDNRLHSTDSRFSEVGLVKFDKIKGKVIFRIYPFNKMGII